MTSRAEIRELEPEWYAVHVHSNHERKVAADLQRQEFEIFLPEYKTLSRRKDRRKMIEKPLFPGYIFVRTTMSPENRLAIIKTKSIVRLVGPGNNPAPISEREIESIRLLLNSATDSGPHSHLVTGQLVQVLDGSLKGVVGRVETSPRGMRIVVSVDLLGRAVSANLETTNIVPFIE